MATCIKKLSVQYTKYNTQVYNRKQHLDIKQPGKIRQYKTGQDKTDKKKERKKRKQRDNFVHFFNKQLFKIKIIIEQILIKKASSSRSLYYR